MSRALRTLLREERTLILAGDFAGLASVQTRMERLIGGRPLPRATARAVADEMRQNQRLIAAALDGVTSARARLDALAQAQASLKVYGPGGHASEVVPGKRGFERKA